MLIQHPYLHLIKQSVKCITSHSFIDELLTGVKVSTEDQALVEVCEHGVLQRDARLLLQRLEGLGVVVLPEVLQTQTDGLLFTVLHRRQKEVNIRTLLTRPDRAVGLTSEEITPVLAFTTQAMRTHPCIKKKKRKSEKCEFTKSVCKNSLI